METKLKTSPENKLEKLLSNNNFRNSQNYVLDKEKGYEVVRKYDSGIIKKILILFFTWILLQFVFGILMIISVLFFKLILIFFPEIKDNLKDYYLIIYSLIIYIFSIIITIYKLNKIGEKRFNVLIINLNKDKIHNISKDKEIDLFNIGYLLVKK